jgi:hypothetical protein
MGIVSFAPVAYLFPPLIATVMAVAAFVVGRGWRRNRRKPCESETDSDLDTFQG